MKQHITKEQFAEIAGEARKKWDLFWLDRDRLFFNTSKCEECETVNLPNIGELIEFLEQDDRPFVLLRQSSWHGNNWKLQYFRNLPKELTESAFHTEGKEANSKQLVDALWEAVKEISMSQNRPSRTQGIERIRE